MAKPTAFRNGSPRWQRGWDWCRAAAVDGRAPAHCKGRYQQTRRPLPSHAPDPRLALGVACRGATVHARIDAVAGRSPRRSDGGATSRGWRWHVVAVPEECKNARTAWAVLAPPCIGSRRSIRQGVRRPSHVGPEPHEHEGTRRLRNAPDGTASNRLAAAHSICYDPSPGDPPLPARASGYAARRLNLATPQSPLPPGSRLALGVTCLAYVAAA